jgi:hypothetical protein
MFSLTKMSRVARHVIVGVLLLTGATRLVPPVSSPAAAQVDASGSGTADRIACMACVTLILGASVTGSIAAVLIVLGSMDSVAAFWCFYYCSRWNA